MSLHYQNQLRKTQNGSLLSNDSHYLPSIHSFSKKSVSPKNKSEKEILTTFLIDKYTKKFTKNSKTKAFLVKKAIEDALIHNNLPSKAMKKLTKSLYEENKQILESLPQKANPVNENKIDKKEENVICEPVLQKPPQKKLLSEIIPGYRYRKEYYDFDEISMEGSEKSESVKSIYRLKSNHDEWAWLIKNDVDNYKNQIQKSQALLRKQQQRFREELDQQLQEKEEMKSKQKKTDWLYHDIMLKQIKKDEANEQEQNSQKLKNQESAKKELDKQNEDFLKNQALEKKIDRKLKSFLNQKFQKEIAEEHFKIQEKRKRYLEINQEMMRESNENRQRLLLENQKEREADVKLTEDYMRDVEKMLADREIQKKLKMEEIQKKYGDFSESLKRFDGSRINMEDQIQLKYFKQKEEEEKQDNLRRLQKIRENKKIIKDSLTKQIKDKEILKEKEIQMNKEQAEYWKQDTLEFLEEENSKKTKNKQRTVSYMEALKTQTDISKQLFSPQRKMNDEELLQNKHHLKLLASQDGDSLVYRDLIKLKKKIY